MFYFLSFLFIFFWHNINTTIILKKVFYENIKYNNNNKILYIIEDEIDTKMKKNYTNYIFILVYE